MSNFKNKLSQQQEDILNEFVQQGVKNKQHLANFNYDGHEDGCDCAVCDDIQFRKNLEIVLNEKDSMNTKQPKSITNDEPYIWDLVKADMIERDLIGEKKHGTRLQPYNGRDVLKDAYQEALDLVAYLRQAIYERDNKKGNNQ